MQLFGKKKDSLMWYGKKYDSIEEKRAAVKKHFKDQKDKKKEKQKSLKDTAKKVVDTVKTAAQFATPSMAAATVTKKALEAKGKGKSLLDLVKGDKYKQKEKSIKASVASGKANRAASEKMKAAEKTYAKESMFAKAADNRDKAKTTTGKARPFGEAKAAAEKADKDRFMWKGKSYFTTRGAAENKDKMKVRIAEKGSIKKKSTLDADTRKSYEKRVAWMKKRKAAGKNYSAKNLKELEAKLAAN